MIGSTTVREEFAIKSLARSSIVVTGNYQSGHVKWNARCFV